MVEVHGRYSYILGKEPVIGNIYDCKLTIDGEVSHVFAHKLPSKDLAREYCKILDELSNKCCYFVRPKFYCSGPDKESGILFHEVLTTFDKWADEPHELFYGYRENPFDGDKKECRGVGDTFIDVFGHVAQALEVTTTKEIAHGNLLDGVFFDLSGNVKIANFELDQDLARSDLVCALKDDLESFKILVQRAIKRQPSLECSLPIRPYSKEVLLDDLSSFFMLFEVEVNLTSVVDFQKYVRWIYNSVIFQNAEKVSVFIGVADEFLNYHEAAFGEGHFLEMFRGWREQVKDFGDKIDPNLEKVASNIEENCLYSQPEGIVRFAFNAFIHPDLGLQTRLDSLEQVFTLFPHLVGLIYHGMFKFSKSLNFDGGFVLDKYWR